MQIFNQMAMMLTMICIRHNLYFIIALVYGVIRTGMKCKLLKKKASRLVLSSMSDTSNVASQGDMGYNSTKSTHSLETFRLFLRVRNTYDRRLTYKIHMWSRNISRSI